MERWVQVWQITDGLGIPLALRFPAHQLWQLIDREAQNGADLYNRDRDGTTTLLEALPGASRPHLALHTIRRSNLPSEDAGGRIVDLTIDPRHGLAEGTHFLFCPRNVVICLYNHVGPRIGRLGNWLETRTGLSVQFTPLYRRDTWAVIEQMQRLTQIELSIPADQIAVIGDDPSFDPSLLDALRASARVSHGGLVHLVWSVGTGGHSVPQGRMRELAHSLVRSDKTGFKGAKVSGRVEGSTSPIPVDLLHDQLVTRRSVEPERERSRRLSTGSAYEAMDETYELFKQQIQEAIEPVAAPHIALPDALIPPTTDEE